MMRMTKWFGIVATSVVLMSAVSAQNLVDRLRDAGSISFQLADAAYRITLGFPEIGCDRQEFRSGNLGAQDPLSFTFQSGTLNFQATINQLVNSIQSDAVVNFVGADLGNNVVEWTVDQTFNPTLCVSIFIEGTEYRFEIVRVYGKFRMQVSEIDCVDDPLGMLNRQVSLQLTPTGGDEHNYMGFDGFVPDGQCTTRYFCAIATANTLQYTAYGGDCPACPGNGDVDGNGCVDDADLLAVLFAFGSSEAGCADVNSDGVVDDADLLTVLFAFGSGC